MKVLNNPYQYSQDEATAIALDVPGTTVNYSPVSNQSMIDLIYELTDKMGYELKTKNVTLNKGSFVFKYGLCPKGSQCNDVLMQIAGFNSYNKRLAAGIAVGSQVFVCENGMLSGSEMMHRRIHTGYAPYEFREEVLEKLELLPYAHEQILKDIEPLRYIKLSRTEMAELAGRMIIQEKLITPKEFSIIGEEIMKPSFDYGTDGNTLYDMYQHTTFALKEGNAVSFLREHGMNHEFFTKDLVAEFS